MNDSLAAETHDLVRSWRAKPKETLRSYLVTGVQDPRLNVQSILTRHFLITRLVGDRLGDLREQELLHALKLNARRVLGLPLAEAELNRFAKRWRKALGPVRAGRLSVLEPACGSANDYRFLHEYGIAGLLDYKGFDLSERNVENAREMFPAVPFERGNVFDVSEPDASFDYVLVSDLFEHLSLEGMEAAAAEVFRVSRRGVLAHFFNMAGIPRHIARPMPARSYHWNTLSVGRMRDLFRGYSRRVEVTHVHEWLTRTYSGYAELTPFLEACNPSLYTFRAEK
jgi:SAM-dependent methyltransferase